MKKRGFATISGVVFGLRNVPFRSGASLQCSAVSKTNLGGKRLDFCSRFVLVTQKSNNEQGEV